MVSKTLTSLLILACVLVLPIVAQTPAPAGTANQTMGTNPNPVHHHKGSAAYQYATRLAALLQDTQGSATLDAATWKKIANEANALANRLPASKDGREARTHVREMRKAAMKGDADGAKSHAGMALPYVYKVIEATGPKK